MLVGTDNYLHVAVDRNLRSEAAVQGENVGWGRKDAFDGRPEGNLLVRLHEGFVLSERRAGSFMEAWFLWRV